MSSRRGAGEDNILAMLERDSARRTGPRMSGVRLASYGAAAALAGILAGGVAWLAYDNHQGVQELQAQHEVVNEAVPPAMPDAVPPPQAPAAVAPASPIDVPRTAIADDESTRRRDTIVASAVPSAVPPLVMLPPHELNGTKPAPAVAPSALDTRLAKPAKSAPAPAQAPAQKQAQPKNSIQKKADKTTKPASPAKPAAAPARTKVAAKARPEAARARKAASNAAPDAETPVDSDVALISAIIAHSERHRGERAAAPCSGAKCQPKSARP